MFFFPVQANTGFKGFFPVSKPFDTLIVDYV